MYLKVEEDRKINGAAAFNKQMAIDLDDKQRMKIQKNKDRHKTVEKVAAKNDMDKMARDLGAFNPNLLGGEWNDDYYFGSAATNMMRL